jgi:hypothetical protein
MGEVGGHQQRRVERWTQFTEVDGNDKAVSRVAEAVAEEGPGESRSRRRKTFVGRGLRETDTVFGNHPVKRLRNPFNTPKTEGRWEL